MGKIPGNLCVEQMMDFLNTHYGMSYSTEPVYDAIDDFIMPIYERQRWGYSVPYALSAQCGVHRTYAEYLITKNRLHTKDIRRILRTIGRDNAEIFDKTYVEEQYQKYMMTSFDDSETLTKFKNDIESYDGFLIIAPGASICEVDFSKYMVDRCVITVNFIFERVTATHLFFTNTKRLSYAMPESKSNLMITSNLCDEVCDAGYVFSRNELAYHDDVFCDDSTLMLLNCLKRCGKRNVLVAGFDGFNKSNNNFYNKGLERKQNEDDLDVELRKKILKNTYSELGITFITESVYSSFSTMEI